MLENIARTQIIHQLLLPNRGYVQSAKVVYVPAEQLGRSHRGHSLAFRAVSFDSKAQSIVLAVWRINSDYCQNWALMCNKVPGTLSLVAGSPDTSHASHQTPVTPVAGPVTLPKCKLFSQSDTIIFQ